jgi:hypothetical protein
MDNVVDPQRRAIMPATYERLKLQLDDMTEFSSNFNDITFKNND